MSITLRAQLYPPAVSRRMSLVSCPIPQRYTINVCVDAGKLPAKTSVMRAKNTHIRSRYERLARVPNIDLRYVGNVGRSGVGSTGHVGDGASSSGSHSRPAFKYNTVRSTLFG